MRQHFRPEFLNRVDETILFTPLTPGEIEAIVDLLVEDLRRRLAGWAGSGRGQGLTLELSNTARQYIARSGYNPVFGARPLKRYLQRELETRIGRTIVAGGVPDGARIIVDVKQGALAVEVKEAEKIEAREEETEV